MKNGRRNVNTLKDHIHHNPRKTATRPTFGLLIENTLDTGEGYLPGILAGITAAAQSRDINLLCFVGGALDGLPGVEFDRQRNILYKMVSSETMDGLIIISSLANFVPQEQLSDLYAQYRPLPTVSIGTPITGSHNITINNKNGLNAALNHLIQTHNCQRIAFIRGPEDSLEARIRYQVYTEVLASHNLPFDPDLVTAGLFRFSSGTDAIRQLLDQRQVNFDAIVASNDHMALGALEELQGRGIVVPYDVAVVGFDDIRQAKNAVPSLTTVRQPLLEMGKQAIDSLLAQLAHENLPEQLMLPTELVVRHSCGCQEQVIANVASQRVMDEDETLAHILTVHREAIIADLLQAVEVPSLVATDWAEQLLDSFVEEIVSGSKGLFLSVLDRLLRQVMRSREEVVSWQAVVSVLRHYTLSGTRRDDLSFGVEALLHQSQVFISGETRKAEAQQHLYVEQQNWTLHNIGQLLITNFDQAKLMEIITDGLPQLGIPGCYLALYEDARPYSSYLQPPPEWSQMVLACNENGRIPLEPNRQRFLTRHLVPEGVLPGDRRYTMMIEALYFRDEQIGFVLLERGPLEGNVYEVLRGQIASALKGASLLRAHTQAETELRQHRDHLDELVRERTTELATANEHLRQEIAERQRADSALRESEENLRATLNSIGDAVIATDTQSRITRMNPVAEQLTGWTFEEAKGRPLTEVFNIINARTKETAVNPVKQVLESGEIIGLANHTMLIARGTAVYQIADSAAPIRDNHHLITGVVLVFRDVTHEYWMQDALREREAQLRTLIEAIPDLIWLKDPEGIFLICNSKVERLFGAKEAEIAGKTDYDFVDKETADHFRQKDLEAIATGKAIVFEEEVIFASDGHRELIETVKTPMVDSEGNLIGVLGIARDISQRKQAEEALRESKNMLSNVLNTIPVRVFWKDLNGIFLGCNRLFAQDVGKNNPEEIIGVDDYSLSSVEQAELYRNDDRYIVENDLSKINYEEPQTTADGTLAWLNTSKIPLRNSNGEMIGVLGTYEYITERKRAEQLLGAYTAELERSNRELQEFAFVASHDLQEPLRKIQTFGDRLQEKYSPVLDERGQDYLNRMQSAAVRMQTLIVDLLSFSRVRTHGQPFSKVDLHQIIMQVLQDLEIRIAEAKAEIIVEDLPEIEADALQMKQLFQNLLGNALKFRRPDVALKIDVRSRVVESLCEISVVDNGIGFDEKHADRIFIVFERLHGRDTYPGTGIGLAICRRIAERHGGHIRAKSKPGEGTSFIVELPIKQTASSPITVPPMP